MSFLQPFLLIALPLIAVPIIIHLIHQRRFQTVQWAAMTFLLAATKMSKGYARIRQWLILAARVLAIAGLIFAISRPLSSGWLGLAAGGRVDTTIILIDRSASMSQIGAGGRTKLETGIRRLQDSLGKLESARYVLIDSVGLQPYELNSVDELIDLSQVMPATATADIPMMLQLTEQYLRENQPSRTEVWICSDSRSSDWLPNSGRWRAFRDELSSRPQTVRFHSLVFNETTEANYLLVGESVRRLEDDEGARLSISFRIIKQGESEAVEAIPIQAEINGVISEIEIELAGSDVKVVDYEIPLESGSVSGWGRLSLPADENEQDNHFYFIYEQEITRRTLIVTEDEELVRPLELAASVSPDPSITVEATVCGISDVVGIDSDDYSLVLWHTAIPSTDAAEHLWLSAFRQRGGVLMFLPSEVVNTNRFAGVSWSQWEQRSETVASWQLDGDLLGNTLSGDALPVGDVRVERGCGVAGEFKPIATLTKGGPFLVRAIDVGAAVYFCTTTVRANDSNLASSGVVMFAMMHRALQEGVKSLSLGRSVIAGRTPFTLQSEASNDDTEQAWRRLSGSDGTLSTEFHSHAGVYQSGKSTLAVNRSELEDATELVSESEMEELFQGLTFRAVRDEVGAERSLIQEIWRLFMMLMVLMLLAESALSLPRRMRAHDPLLHSGAAS